MYRFIRCQPYVKCPDLQGWYLVLEPDDTEALISLHKGVSGLYFSKFGADPHIIKSEMSGYFHPIRLAASWLVAVQKFLLAGTTVLVNSSGGMMPIEGVKILAETQLRTMAWPDIYEDEVITISRWPEERHFYLSSNKNRVFVPTKYPEYEAARHVAGKYTDNIKTKGC